MGFSIVSHLITHARLEDKCAAIFQFRVQFTLKAKQYVSLAAPMVSEITLRVFDHANADVAEMLRAPVSCATVSLVLGLVDAGPIGGSEWNARHVHDFSLSLSYQSEKQAFFLIRAM